MVELSAHSVNNCGVDKFRRVCNMTYNYDFIISAIN